MKIQIRGMRFFMGDDGRNDYQTLAHAEVYMPDLGMTLTDVRLAWSPKGDMFVARSGSPSTRWFYHGDFGKALAASLADMFRRMGGNMPAATPEKAANKDAAIRRLAERKAREADAGLGGAAEEEADRVFGND